MRKPFTIDYVKWKNVFSENFINTGSGEIAGVVCCSLPPNVDRGCYAGRSDRQEIETIYGLASYPLRA
jgi:hypothetical protein